MERAVQYMERANERLQLLVPITLAIIFLLLFLHFRSAMKSALLLGLLPFCLVGAAWLMWALDFNMSIAVGVGSSPWPDWRRSWAS